MENMDPFAWLIVSILGLIGMGWTIFTKTKSSPVSPPGKSEVEIRAEEKAGAATARAIEAHNKTVTDAKAEAEKAGAALSTRLDKEKDKLLTDPDALNGYLKNVGKDVRGGGG